MIIAKRVGAGSLGFLAKCTFAYDLRTAEIEVCACVYVCDLEICRNSNFVNYPRCNIRIVLTIFQLWLVTQNKILQNLVLLHTLFAISAYLKHLTIFVLGKVR